MDHLVRTKEQTPKTHPHRSVIARSPLFTSETYIIRSYSVDSGYDILRCPSPVLDA